MNHRYYIQYKDGNEDIVQEGFVDLNYNKSETFNDAAKVYNEILNELCKYDKDKKKKISIVSIFKL